MQTTIFRVGAAALSFVACVALAQQVPPSGQGAAVDFEAARKALDEQRWKVRKLRATDPERYVEAYREYLVAAEKVVKRFPDHPPAQGGLRNEVVKGFVDLGHFARFRMKRPQLAISLYDTRIDGETNGMAEFAAADTYQFDLGDKRTALSRYMALLRRTAGKTSGNDMEAGILRFSGTWLRHQVAWLETGKRFSGTLAADECGAAMLLLMYGQTIVPGDDLGLGEAIAKANSVANGGTLPDGDRQAIAAKLAALPPSALALFSTARLASVLPDASAILFFLDRNDPAGYASACFFSEVDRLSRMPAQRKGTIAQAFPGLVLDPTGAASPVAMAAARFVADRGIARAQPDPRMSTPEKTWELFISSMKANDLDTAKSCVTPSMQPVVMALAQGSSGGLKAIGESFTGFALSERPTGGSAEGFVTRGGRAGVVSFVNVGGEWKIASM